MENMTYAGVHYRTSHMGTYVTHNPRALTVKSTHNRDVVRRQENLTLTDPYMIEAFEAYPLGFNWEKLEGWSRSFYSNEGHMRSILKMDSHRPFPKPFDASMLATDNYCRSYFETLGKVQSLRFRELDQVPFEPTSAAGIGIPGRKGDDGNLLKAIHQATATINNCMRSGIQGVIDNSTPDMAYTRTQLTQLTEGLKVRNVFGEAFQYILIEGLSAAPLMQYFSQHDTFFFVGKDPRSGVPNLLEDFKRNCSLLLSIDWSAFDTSVEYWEIIDAFDLLESMLIFKGRKSRSAFEFAKIFFINRKLAGPDGFEYFKHASVPSGSYFTMLIDSIVNWRRILYLHHKAYGKFPERISVQGDDSLVGTTKEVTTEGLALQIPAISRWELNAYKCPVGKSGSTVPFLQRKLKFGDQARDVDKVERLAIYPEYEVTDPQISSYRARALWEDCNYESNILGFATEYLEKTYGIPTHVPSRFRNFLDTLYESKKS